MKILFSLILLIKMTSIVTCCNSFDIKEDIDMHNNKIRNLADPVKETDAVNKKYVDDQIKNAISKKDDRKNDGQEFFKVIEKTMDPNKKVLELYETENSYQFINCQLENKLGKWINFDNPDFIKNTQF